LIALSQPIGDGLLSFRRIVNRNLTDYRNDTSARAPYPAILTTTGKTTGAAILPLIIIAPFNTSQNFKKLWGW
jgi:hypothetical protein